jgi:hypothetical protein
MMIFRIQMLLTEADWTAYDQLLVIRDQAKAKFLTLADATRVSSSGALGIYNINNNPEMNALNEQYSNAERAIGYPKLNELHTLYKTRPKQLAT